MKRLPETRIYPQLGFIDFIEFRIDVIRKSIGRLVHRYKLFGIVFLTKRIAVFLPNWIGDVVMATPALRTLRQSMGPAVEMVGVCRPYIREVLSGSAWLEDTLMFDPRSSNRELRTESVIRQLRGMPMDAAVLLPNSFRAAYVAWRAGIPQRIGFDHHCRRPLLTEALVPQRNGWKRSPVSTVDSYLQVVEAFGCKVSSRVPELYTTARGELAADKVWKNFGWQARHSVIGLNTGGAYGAAKHWPNQHTSQLAIRLADAGHKVLILCGPKEVEAASEIECLARHPDVRSMADQDLSLEASKACLRRLDLLVSTDSGPRHMAAAFDVPTVVIFGPIDPRWSRNYATQVIEMVEDLPCAPCGKRRCPLGHHRCMNDVTPARVYAAVQALLGQSEAGRAA